MFNWNYSLLIHYNLDESWSVLLFLPHTCLNIVDIRQTSDIYQGKPLTDIKAGDIRQTSDRYQGK